MELYSFTDFRRFNGVSLSLQSPSSEAGGTEDSCLSARPLLGFLLNFGFSPSGPAGQVAPSSRPVFLNQKNEVFMPSQKIPAILCTHFGTQYWIFDCPYCRIENRVRIGDYTLNPKEHKIVKSNCCGSTFEMTLPNMENT